MKLYSKQSRNELARILFESCNQEEGPDWFDQVWKGHKTLRQDYRHQSKVALKYCAALELPAYWSLQVSTAEEGVKELEEDVAVLREQLREVTEERDRLRDLQDQLRHLIAPDVLTVVEAALAEAQAGR